MKKQRITRFVCIIFMFITILFSFKYDALAYDMVSGVSNIGNSGKTGSAGNATKSIMGTAINVIQIVGTGIAIIMLVMVAVKYMSSAPSERAEFKKSAVAYVVGACIIFAASGILGIIQNFANNNL